MICELLRGSCWLVVQIRAAGKCSMCFPFLSAVVKQCLLLAYRCSALECCLSFAPHKFRCFIFYENSETLETLAILLCFFAGFKQEATLPPPPHSRCKWAFCFRSDFIIQQFTTRRIDNLVFHVDNWPMKLLMTSLITSPIGCSPSERKLALLHLQKHKT